MHEFDIGDLMLAFARSTMRVLKQDEQIREQAKEIDRLRLADHNKEIRIQSLVDKNQHLVDTLKEKVETVRMSKEETNYSLEVVVDPAPRIIHPFQ